MAPQKKKPVIIAMKGQTCTGKTRFANILARKLKCGAIDLDDVYDCFSDHMIIQQQQQQQQQQQADKKKQQQQQQQQIVKCLDCSFESVCRIAVKQLELIPFWKDKKIIIDSPLLLQSHMERLLVMSKSIGARLVIVECRARDKYEWEQRFIRAQKRGTSSSTNYCSYKPSTWKDLQLETTRYNWALQEQRNRHRRKCTYPGTNVSRSSNTHGSHKMFTHIRRFQAPHWICALLCVLGKYEYDTSADVSKLVVDTTKHFMDVGLCFAVILLCKFKRNHSVDYQTWEGDLFGDLEGEKTEVPKIDGLYSDRDVHILTLSNDATDGSSSSSSIVVSCRACLKPISSGPSYKCSFCDLSLHKLCAELPDKRQLLPHQNPPFVNPNSHEFIFPETHRCKFHPEGFNSHCRDCAFESNLRCALVPTVVYLDCHQHPLIFMMTSTANTGHNRHFQCDACGYLGGEAFYRCRTSNCPLILHVNCALLPPTREDIHHRHHLSLTPPPDDDDSDEYYCNSCEETRNPRHWIYYCEKCEFASHLYCDGFSPR